MAALESAPGSRAPAYSGLPSLPPTRPRGWVPLLLPLPVAAAAGLGSGIAPEGTMAVAAAVVSALVLVPRVEWAALALIWGAVLEGYLTWVSPWATEWLAAVLVVAWLVRRAEG